MSFWSLLTAGSCTPERLETLLAEKKNISWFDKFIIELILGRLYREAYNRDLDSDLSRVEQVNGMLPDIYRSKQFASERSAKDN